MILISREYCLPECLNHFGTALVVLFTESLCTVSVLPIELVVSMVLP